MDFRLATSVASFGMILRDSPHRGDASLRDTLAWAKKSRGSGEGSLRAEFVLLVQKAPAAAESVRHFAMPSRH
jgi:Ca-activated chloride channel homolog